MKKRIIIILLIILLSFNLLDQVLAVDLGIIGEGAVLIEQDTGKVLYEKNKDKKMYPASTTKIMTALLALEHGDLKEIVTIGEEIENLPGDSSSAGLFVGQKISLEELLYGLLLPSGNDTANSIAINIAKKVSDDEITNYQVGIEVFVALMNKKANEIGAKNTHYTNPHGYHDDEHYTTPWDMAMITCKAMENDKFKKIIKTKEFTYRYSGNEIEDENKQWQNYNELLQKDNNNYYTYANGVKTGRTTIAGRCLVSSATKDDLNVIAVIYNSTEEDIWKDSKIVLSFGIENFEHYTLAKKNQDIARIKVEKAYNKDGNELNVTTNKTLKALINKTDISKVEKQIYITKNQNKPELYKEQGIRIEAPIEKGEVIGYIKYSIDGEGILQGDLIADKTIRKKNVFINFWWLFAILLITFIVTFVYKSDKSK